MAFLRSYLWKNAFFKDIFGYFLEHICMHLSALKSGPYSWLIYVRSVEFYTSVRFLKSVNSTRLALLSSTPRACHLSTSPAAQRRRTCHVSRRVKASFPLRIAYFDLFSHTEILSRGRTATFKNKNLSSSFSAWCASAPVE